MGRRERRERSCKVQGEKGGRQGEYCFCQRTESQGREAREGCTVALLSLSLSLTHTKVSDNLAAALLFKSGMAPHP